MRYLNMTPDELKAWLEDPDVCPFCSGQDFRTSELYGLESSSYRLVRRVECVTCHFELEAGYTLSDAKLVDVECEICHRAIEQGQEVAVQDGDLCHKQCLEGPN